MRIASRWLLSRAEDSARVINSALQDTTTGANH